MASLAVPAAPTKNKETLQSWLGPLTVLEPRLHRPAASRSEGTGCGRGVGPVSEVRDLPQRCPRTGIQPFPPPATGAYVASQPRLHSAARAPTLLLGRCAGPSSPGRLRAPPPPLRMPKQTPCFVLSFRRPQGGGARDSPRRDPPLSQQSWKKSPAPKRLSPVSFEASSTRYGFTEPILPLRFQGARWNLGTDFIRLLIPRRKEREC